MSRSEPSPTVFAWHDSDATMLEVARHTARIRRFSPFDCCPCHAQIIQLRCEVCGGRGLVPSAGAGRDKYLRKCPQCGGFFPWVSSGDERGPGRKCREDKHGGEGRCARVGNNMRGWLQILWVSLWLGPRALTVVSPTWRPRTTYSCLEARLGCLGLRRLAHSHVQPTFHCCRVDCVIHPWPLP